MNRPCSGFIRRSTLLILIAAIAAGLGLWAAQMTLRGSSTPTLAITLLLPTPREIAPFTLQRGADAVLSNADLKGRWTLAFIGYTHCPDVCPTTLGNMAAAEKLWNAALPEAKRPRILFVSADPERDSPERTQAYARFFSPDAIGATGEVPALEAFARSLGMVFMKVPAAEGQDPANYGVDHSTQITLIDPQGRFAGLIRPPHKPADLASDLIAIVQQSP